MLIVSMNYPVLSLSQNNRQLGVLTARRMLPTLTFRHQQEHGMTNWAELRKTATMVGTFGSFLLLGYLSWKGWVNNFVVKEDLIPLEEKISRVDVKVDKLEGKVDKLEGKVDKLEGKVDKLSDQLMTLIQGLLFKEEENQ